MRIALTALFLHIVLGPSPAPASDIVLASGVTVGPGQSAGLAVSLSTPAPAGGVFVTLSSSDLSKVTVNPANVYVPAGMTVPFAQPQVSGVNYGPATISASAFGWSGGSQVVRVMGALFGPASVTVERGVTQNLTLTLASPTPAALTIAVTCDNPAVASVPASVTIAAGGSTVVVPVTGQSAGSTVIRVGSLPDIAPHAVNATVTVPAVITPGGAASVALGQSAALQLTLGSPAGPGGVTVTLGSDNPYSVTVSPGSVWVPPGATAPPTQPQVTGANIGQARITATASGYLMASWQVVVTATLTMSPQPLYIAAGSIRLLSLVLSGAAPSSDAPITGDRAKNGFVNGLTVQLSSSNAQVAAVQPTVQFYPDGSAITMVVVQVTGVAPGTATIHASAPPYIADTVATIVVQ